MIRSLSMWGGLVLVAMAGALQAREPAAVTEAVSVQVGGSAMQSRNARTEVRLGADAAVVQSGLEDRTDVGGAIQLRLSEGVSVRMHGVVLRTDAAQGGYPLSRPRDLQLQANVWEVDLGEPGACADRPAPGRYSRRGDVLLHNGTAVEGGRREWAWGTLSLGDTGQVRVLLRPMGDAARVCAG